MNQEDQLWCALVFVLLLSNSSCVLPSGITFKLDMEIQNLFEYKFCFFQFETKMKGSIYKNVNIICSEKKWRIGYAITDV